MVDAALHHIRILEDHGVGPGSIKVSLKASDVPTNLAANRRFATLDNGYPLHLGLTEAGPVQSGSVKSAMGIGILLAEGIGDTIRVSLVGEPEDVGWAVRYLASPEARYVTGQTLIIDGGQVLPELPQAVQAAKERPVLP